VSSDIQNKNNAVISDYNKFITSNLDYSKQDKPNSLLFTPSTSLTKTGLGNRQTNNQKVPKATQF
jgi:hypothetical protein